MGYPPERISSKYETPHSPFSKGHIVALIIYRWAKSQLDALQIAKPNAEGTQLEWRQKGILSLEQCISVIQDRP